MQNFVFASTTLLNPIRIPIKHLENRQGLQFCGKFLRHVQRRSEGHHGVESDVVLTAKSPRIGERSGGRQTPQIRARTQLFYERGQQPTDWCLLHETD